jgi:membrane-bound ClpP family serine protease
MPSVIESRGANLFVRARSEIWHAESAAPLREGDRVRVVAVQQLTLRGQIRNRSRWLFEKDGAHDTAQARE